MADFKTYSKTIFGQGNNVWEGVDQGYDPCAEPAGRVQTALDVEFANSQMKKRKGWEKAYHMHNQSLLNMSAMSFKNDDRLAVQTGRGEVKIIRGLPNDISPIDESTSSYNFSSVSSSSSSLGFSSLSSKSSSSTQSNISSSSSSSSSSLRYTSSSTSNAGSWQTVFTQTLTTESGGWGDFTFAPVIPAGAMSSGGSKIRISFQASPLENATIAFASIVERDGTSADGVTAPTQLLFSGLAGVVIPAGTFVTSDEVVMAIDNSKDYLIRVEVPNDYSADNFGALAIGAYSGSYYRYGDYGTAQIMEPATLYNQFYAINKIEVFA